MILWTIQNEQFYKKLIYHGNIKAYYRYIDKDFKYKYKWMAHKMLDMKLVTRLTYPIWAWRYWESKKKARPDLRSSWHLPTGTKGVRIEFEIDDNKVLLSQTQMWSWILNNQFLPKDANEFDNIEDDLSQGEIEDSWHNIFDLNWGCEDFWGKRDDRGIQACICHLSIDQIINVKHFIAR